MKTRTYSAGETIIAEGTFGNQTYLITEGMVLICKATGPKSRIPITTLGVGEVFGEMYLLDDVGFRSATVVAKSDVTVEILGKAEMEAMLGQTPDVVMSMLKTLSKRLADTSQENTLLKYRNTGLFEKVARMFAPPPRR